MDAARVEASVLLSGGSFQPANQFTVQGDDAGLLPGKVAEILNVKLDQKSLIDAVQSLPPVLAVFVMVLCLLPLFWGWRIMRVVYSFVCAIMLGSFATALLIEFIPSMADNTVARIAVGVLGAIVGGGIGWYYSKISGAVVGAIVLGGLFAIPGVLIQHQWLAIGLGGIGVIIGLLIGWSAGYYLEALDTALAASAVIGICTFVLVSAYKTDLAAPVGVGAFLVAAIAGVMVQFKTVVRDERGERVRYKEA